MVQRHLQSYPTQPCLAKSKRRVARYSRNARTILWHQRPTIIHMWTRWQHCHRFCRLPSIHSREPRAVEILLVRPLTSDLWLGLTILHCVCIFVCPPSLRISKLAFKLVSMYDGMCLRRSSPTPFVGVSPTIHIHSPTTTPESVYQYLSYWSSCLNPSRVRSLSHGL